MTFVQELFQNKIIGISILSWAVAQLIKIIIDVYTTKKIDLNLIMLLLWQQVQVYFMDLILSIFQLHSVLLSLLCMMLQV